MGLTEKQFKSNNDNFVITFSITDGTLEIARRAVTVKADDKTKVYGDPDPELTATVTGLVDGDTLRYTISREEGEDVGEYVITPEEAKTFFLFRSVAIGNYDVTFETGILTITPAVLTVTTPSATKAFDGTALAGGTATITGLKRGETATVTATGSQTAVGSSRNGYNITWGTAKASNYTIVENLGTLTVTAAIIPEVIPVPPAPPTPPEDIEPPIPPRGDPEPPTEPPTEDIVDPEPPLANDSHWALLNLILAIVSAILAIVMIITFIVGKKDDDDDDPNGTGTKAAEDEEDRKKKRNALKFLGLIPGIGGIILFLLTEDMTAKMQFTDKWTIWMAIIAIIALVLMIVIRNKKADKEEEEQENA